MKNGLFIALWLLALPCIASVLDDQNSEALKLFRAGKMEEAEKIWTDIAQSKATSPGTLRSVKANMACLYHRTGRDQAGEVIERELGLKSDFQTKSEELKANSNSKTAFQPLQIVDNPKAKNVLETIKEQIVQSLKEKHLNIQSTSPGVIYKLPGEHKALICFEVKVTASGMAQTTYSYSITAQDHGGGDIRVLDKQCHTGEVIATDEYREKKRAEEEKNMENVRKVQKFLDDSRAEQNSFKSQTEIDSLNDISRRQAQGRFAR